jgi:hypothetical protein
MIVHVEIKSRTITIEIRGTRGHNQFLILITVCKHTLKTIFTRTKKRHSLFIIIVVVNLVGLFVNKHCLLNFSACLLSMHVVSFNFGYFEDFSFRYLLRAQQGQYLKEILLNPCVVRFYLSDMRDVRATSPFCLVHTFPSSLSFNMVSIPVCFIQTTSKLEIVCET